MGILAEIIKAIKGTKIWLKHIFGFVNDIYIFFSSLSIINSSNELNFSTLYILFYNQFFILCSKNTFWYCLFLNWKGDQSR